MIQDDFYYFFDSIWKIGRLTVKNKGKWEIWRGKFSLFTRRLHYILCLKSTRNPPGHISRNIKSSPGNPSRAHIGGKKNKQNNCCHPDFNTVKTFRPFNSFKDQAGRCCPPFLNPSRIPYYNWLTLMGSGRHCTSSEDATQTEAIKWKN